MTRNTPWSPHRYDSIERMNDIAGPELNGLEHYLIAATRALYGSRISNSRLLEHFRNTNSTNRIPPRSSASINMLSAVPSHTHGTNGTDHNGQVDERTLNCLIDRGAEGSMPDGLRKDDGDRRNTELGTLKEEKHSTTKTETKEADWKTLMEETLVAFSSSTIISRGPNNGIAGADMRIISNGNPETQDRRNDGYNDDTQSNGRGVTNGYAFDSDSDRLTGTPD